MLIGTCNPEVVKAALRIRYKRDAIFSPARCYAEAVDRAREFWPTYEQVNRDYCPDDPVFSTARAGAAISTTADHLHFKAAAAGQARILELIIGGEATSSAVNRIAIERENATLSGATALTPEKFNTLSPAAAGTYGHTNGSAILTASTYLLVFAVNAFGGFIDWKAAPGEELLYQSGEVIGIRSLSGTSTFSSTAVFEEL